MIPKKIIDNSDMKPVKKKFRKGKERMNELDLRPLRPHAGGD